MVKKTTAMERLLKEGFFESKEAALPYLMSGAVTCGAIPVRTGGQIVPLDLPMNVKGLGEKYVGKGGYKLEGAIADLASRVGVASALTLERAPAALPIACASTEPGWSMRWKWALVSWPAA